MLLITVLSVMNGFEAELRDRILGMASHVEISGSRGGLQDWQDVESQVDQRLSDVTGSAPYISGEGMVRSGRNMAGTMIRGVLPAKVRSVSDVADHMVAGNFDSLEMGKYRIVIGAELAARYRAAGHDVTGTARAGGGGLVPLDVTRPDAFAGLAAALAGRPVDLLICNAGIYPDKGQVLDTGYPAAMWAETFATNVTGVFLTVQALLPNLRAAEAAKIAIISSQMASHARAPAARRSRRKPGSCARSQCATSASPQIIPAKVSRKVASATSDNLPTSSAQASRITAFVGSYAVMRQA